MDGNKPNGKDKKAWVLISIGGIGILIAAIMLFIVGVYLRDLIWVAPVGVVGIILVNIGVRLLDKNGADKKL